MKYLASVLLVTGFVWMAVFGALAMTYSMESHADCATAAFGGGTCFSAITVPQDIAFGLLVPLLFILFGILLLRSLFILPCAPLFRKRIRTFARAPDGSFLRWLSLFELSPSR